MVQACEVLEGHGKHVRGRGKKYRQKSRKGSPIKQIRAQRSRIRKYALRCRRRESIMYQRKLIWILRRLSLHIRKQSQTFALRRSNIYIKMGQCARETARNLQTRSLSRIGVAADVGLPLSTRGMTDAVSMEWKRSTHNLRATKRVHYRVMWNSS